MADIAYALGASQPGRSYGTPGRYGFQGYEIDKEINGDTYTAEYWEYDSRIGKRWNLDPVVNAGESGYAALANNPINTTDPEGNVVIFINGQHNGEGGQAKYRGGYDTKVMNIIGDHSARYVDGALGGWKNTLEPSMSPLMGSTIIKILTKSNVSLKTRIKAGEAQGMVPP